jgi:hypothetical protein
MTFDGFSWFSAISFYIVVTIWSQNFGIDSAHTAGLTIAVSTSALPYKNQTGSTTEGELMSLEIKALMAEYGNSINVDPDDTFASIMEEKAKFAHSLCCEVITINLAYIKITNRSFSEYLNRSKEEETQYNYSMYIGHQAYWSDAETKEELLIPFIKEILSVDYHPPESESIVFHLARYRELFKVLKEIGIPQSLMPKLESSFLKAVHMCGKFIGTTTSKGLRDKDRVYSAKKKVSQKKADMKQGVLDVYHRLPLEVRKTQRSRTGLCRTIQGKTGNPPSINTIRRYLIEEGIIPKVTSEKGK